MVRSRIHGCLEAETGFATPNIGFQSLLSSGCLCDDDSLLQSDRAARKGAVLTRVSADLVHSGSLSIWLLVEYTSHKVTEGGLLLMCQRGLLFLGIVSLLAVVPSIGVFAQSQEPAEFSLKGGTSAPCPLPEQYSEERPDPAGVVTEVGVGVYFLDLFEINDVEQTFKGDVLVVMQWRDPRLADPMRGEARAFCTLPFDRVWIPTLEFMNVRVVEDHHKDMTFIDAEGTVTYARRRFLTFSSPMDLARFPFDRQVFSLELRSIIAGVDEVQLKVMEGFTGLAEDSSLSGWDLSTARGVVKTGFAPLRQAEYSSYVWQVEGKRQVGFFTRKLIIPLALIVSMSWAIFWISPAQIAPQMGIGATSMLTLIAYHFALANFLPRISYLTLADQFILWSLILVFLAVMEAVSTAALVNYGNEVLALRIDRWCRLIFPLAFAVILFVTIL